MQKSFVIEVLQKLDCQPKRESSRFPTKLNEYPDCKYNGVKIRKTRLPQLFKGASSKDINLLENWLDLILIFFRKKPSRQIESFM